MQQFHGLSMFIHETAVGDGNLMKILDETNHETAAGGDPPS
jgi:hypothetical protein